MTDANGGTGILKGYLQEIDLTCGNVITTCDFHVGDILPFEVLLGRTWQRNNYVTISEKKDGTYLEFRDRDSDVTKHEVLVSPQFVTQEMDFRFNDSQAYTLTVQPEVKTTLQEATESVEENDTPYDAERRALRKILGTTIVAARRMSLLLSPPPPIQTYSAMRNMGARMFFQILEKHRSKWDVFNYKKWSGILPIEEAENIDLISFLAEHEIQTLETVTEETLVEEALDLMRFLDIAVEDARQESPLLRPLPPPEIPDQNYENTRIFHHYFSAYRHRLKPHQSLSRISNHNIVEFIMKEYDRQPVSVPLTHKEAEQQTFRLGLINFLITHEGEMFANSKYSSYFANPDQTPREDWPYILLYWRYR